jgi:sugar phosphate isomerase/epimerase
MQQEETYIMQTPNFSVGAATTPNLTFAEALAAYREGGADAIGIIDGPKLEGEPEALDRFQASGLKAGFCIPSTTSILPRPQLRASYGGGEDPETRIGEMQASIRRLAPFEPVFCICVPGPVGEYEVDAAHEIAVDGLRRVARAAADVGVTIALEPLHTSISQSFSFVNTLPDAIALLDEIDEPNTGVLFDVWHLSDTPDVLTHIRTYADRFLGVHVNDRREPTRSWCDRVLPGDGTIDFAAILGALIAAGYDGWYELEVLSDDGRNGNDFPDSLWKRDPVELIRSARQQFTALWEASRAAAAPA